MTAPKQEQDRDQMIIEWMRSNEAFKNLARQYGKGGKPAKLGHEDVLVDQVPKEGMPARPVVASEPGVSELSSKQEALLDWLGGNEAFKRLAKQYGKSFPKP